MKKQTLSCNTQLIKGIRKALTNYRQIVEFRIYNGGDSINIEPYSKSERFAGLQIIYFKQSNIFEFSEYQAGENANELHVFGDYKTIQAAIRRLIKGKKAPIKIWS